MPLNLTKGQKVNLPMDDISSKRILVGLGWKLVDKSNIDIKARILCINSENLHVSADFYDRTKSLSNAIEYYGDVFTFEEIGAKEIEPEETFYIDLGLLSKKITKLKIILNTGNKKHNLEGIEKCFINVRDLDTDEEIIHYDIEENYVDKNGIFIADISRHKEEWEFKAIGKAVKVDDITKMLHLFYRIRLKRDV